MSHASLSAALRRQSPTLARTEPSLAAALAQTVSHPGKLLRGQLVRAAAQRHGLSRHRVEKLACAIEYFHASSLLLDDLPCMDNAVVRRGVPCVHRRYGEATAILASLTLINRAYALVGAALETQPRAVRRAATAMLDRALGLPGLVGGQAGDLAFAHSNRGPALVSRIAAQKTGALFALAVELPALLARPGRRERRALRALCVYWGQLFQLADDLRDVFSTSAEAGKTTGRDQQLVRPNLVLALGPPRAKARFARLAAQAERALAQLRYAGEKWTYLACLHAELVRVPAPSRPAIEHHAA